MALSNVITAFVLVALGLLACVLFATMGGENFSKQMQGTPMLGPPLPPVSPYSGRDFVKSLQSSCAGLYPQTRLLSLSLSQSYDAV